MRHFKLPYAKGHMDIAVPEAQIAGVLESRAEAFVSDGTEEEIVEKALDNPIGSLPLEELVKGKRNMVIITSDHTRPVPSRVTLPILLKRIRRANPGIDITILVATGFHRGMTEEERVQRFGADLVAKERIINHDSEDMAHMVHIGTLPSGGDCLINRLAVETDLLIAEGVINPHFFAGFSGGRKSVLPGIASKVTVMANHCAEFIADPHARTGILEENPIHRDMLYAARTAKLAFILNVVIDPEKHVINAFAGDCVAAHQAGCEFVESLSTVGKVPADIVVTSNGGYPMDQNIYQSVKGMTAAEATCNHGGVIIMVASCVEGHGGQALYDAMKAMTSPGDLLNTIARVPRNETKPYQWKIQILARLLEHFKIIVVTDECDPHILQDMHLDCAENFETALRMAYAHLGKDDASITVIPNGVSVVVK